MLARTKRGKLLRAVAQDPELASLVGVDAERAQLLAFAVAGGLAGFAATLSAAYYGGTSGQYGLRTGLAAMTAAVLGGVGDPRGALLAGVLLGIVSSFSDFFLDAAWTPVLVLALLVLLLVPVWLPGLGAWLVVEDPLQPADVALVMEGTGRDALAAAEGWRQAGLIHDVVIVEAPIKTHALVAYWTDFVRWGIAPPAPTPAEHLRVVRAPSTLSAEQARAALRASYDYYQHMSRQARYGELIPDEIVPEFALAGTPDECVQQLRELLPLGFDEITLIPYATDDGTRAEMITALAREVIGVVRGR
jgi:hypothetical protein